MDQKSFILLLSFVLFSFSAFAQKGGVRGSITDEETGEPIMFATIAIEGTAKGTTSDENGFFSLGGLEKGDYTIVIQYVGYDDQEIFVKVAAGGFKNVKVVMKEGSVKLGEVDVSAEKMEKQSEVKISVTTVTPKSIKRIPAAGGEPDLAQYLQVIPGVIFTGDQGGQLYIRGGSPVQNKILMDGMTIFNPFHSIGFFSVFETDIIRTVDVYTGGFAAEYGGRTSAVVDIKTRDGNKKRFSGKVGANPFVAKAILEGPLMKLNDKGNSLSFLLSAKHSYLESTSKSLYSYVDTAGLPFNFTDFYGKISFNASNGTKLNAFGFNYRDAVNYDIADYNWNASGAGVNFKVVPGSAKMLLGGYITFSSYNAGLEEKDGRPRSSGVQGFNTGLDFTFFGNESELKYGLEIATVRTEFEYFNTLGLPFNQSENSTEVSGFLKYRKRLGRLVLEPSIRAQYYASLGDFVLEPRFGAKINLTENIRLKFAGGLYSQNLISAVNERDIVNLFVGFLSGPDEAVYEPGSTTKQTASKLQKSIHYIGGVEIDLTKDIELNIEPYLKSFPQIINLNRNKLTLLDPDYVTEKGSARGIDLLAKYDKDDLYIYLAYSLGFVTRDDGDQVYSTHFDRRHNVNAIVAYSFGFNKESKKKPWEVSARWNLGSGFPFTLTQGFFQQYTFQDGINSNYAGDNNDLGILYSDERNTGRLPYYHRLDLSVKRTFEFSKYSKLVLTASVTNAYDRQNIFYFDRIRFERVNQLPILPSLNATFEF